MGKFMDLADAREMIEDELGKESITHRLSDEHRWWLISQLILIEQAEATKRIAEALDTIVSRLPRTNG